MDINIMRATRRHLPAIRALYRVFVKDEYSIAPLPAEHLNTNEDRTNAVLRVLDSFESPKKTWLVAMIDKAVIGTALLTIKSHPFLAGEIGRVDLVMVSKDFRRQGVGRALMNELYELARSMGCGWMTLGVLETNEAALRMYKTSGYSHFLLELVKKVD